MHLQKFLILIVCLPEFLQKTEKNDKLFFEKKFFFEIFKIGKILKFFKNRGKQIKYQSGKTPAKTSENLQKI